MEPRIFISHSQSSAEMITPIVATLEKMNIGYVFAQDGSGSSANAVAEISTQVQACTAVLLVISSESVNTPWIPMVVGVATAFGIPIFTFVTGSQIRLPDYLKHYTQLNSIDDLKHKGKDFFTLDTQARFDKEDKENKEDLKSEHHEHTSDDFDKMLHDELKFIDNSVTKLKSQSNQDSNADVFNLYRSAIELLIVNLRKLESNQYGAAELQEWNATRQAIRNRIESIERKMSNHPLKKANRLDLDKNMDNEIVLEFPINTAVNDLVKVLDGINSIYQNMGGDYLEVKNIEIVSARNGNNEKSKLKTSNFEEAH